jgi:hypothetical protein
LNNFSAAKPPHKLVPDLDFSAASLGYWMRMKYNDGSTVALGDIVTLPVPTGTAKARVVMLGETYEHLAIDPDFVSWVEEEKILAPGSIVVEWTEENPFVHDDPQYAPVGNYMFSPVDEFVTRIA